MLSGRWPKPKWIKHNAVQVGSVHPSGRNVKINLQLKSSLFFNQSWTFSSKDFGNDSIPRVAIKRSTKVQKSHSTPRERTVTRRISDKIKERWRPANQALHSNIKPRLLIAYRPRSHTVPQLTNQPLKNDLYLITCIWWKKRDRISSDMPTFIY